MLHVLFNLIALIHDEYDLRNFSELLGIWTLSITQYSKEHSNYPFTNFICYCIQVETWYLTLKKIYKLRIIEKRVLRKTSDVRQTVKNEQAKNYIMRILIIDACLILILRLNENKLHEKAHVLYEENRI
jgi:hypothetical protein